MAARDFSIFYASCDLSVCQRGASVAMINLVLFCDICMYTIIKITSCLPAVLFKCDSRVLNIVY